MYSECVNGTFVCTGTPCFVTCSDDEFKCGSSPVKCIPHKLRCDGVKHCSDGADEQDCGMCRGATTAEKLRGTKVWVPTPDAPSQRPS